MINTCLTYRGEPPESALVATWCHNLSVVLSIKLVRSAAQRVQSKGNWIERMNSVETHGVCTRQHNDSFLGVKAKLVVGCAEVIAVELADQSCSCQGLRRKLSGLSDTVHEVSKA